MPVTTKELSLCLSVSVCLCLSFSVCVFVSKSVYRMSLLMSVWIETFLISRGDVRGPHQYDKAKYWVYLQMTRENFWIKTQAWTNSNLATHWKLDLYSTKPSVAGSRKIHRKSYFLIRISIINIFLIIQFILLSFVVWSPCWGWEEIVERDIFFISPGRLLAQLLKLKYPIFKMAAWKDYGIGVHFTFT